MNLYNNDVNKAEMKNTQENYLLWKRGGKEKDTRSTLHVLYRHATDASTMLRIPGSLLVCFSSPSKKNLDRKFSHLISVAFLVGLFC